MHRIHPPSEVLTIARTLEKAGFETWCVGGAVRDALLGHPHLDWDLATAAHPAQIRNLFPRTVPVGIAFGTVGVVDQHGVMHEVTTFRRDVRTDGRHAEVEFGASLEEDLARRDYTINAIAYSPKQRKLCDPFHGREDLDRGVVRAVGTPDERMREDRLRALRALRFAARFDFQIEPDTWAAIVGSSPYLTRLSPERVRQEIEKTMDQVDKPRRAFELWQQSGAFANLIPSLEGVSTVDLATLDYLPRPGLLNRPGRRMQRLVALFAAVPHQKVGTILKALRFSNAEAAWISAILSAWAVLESEMRSGLLGTSAVKPSAMRKWAAQAGRTRLASVIRLARARWCAERAAGMEAPDPSRVASVYRQAIRIAFHDPIEVTDLAVNGRDLESLGISGPRVGQTLRSLLELVINDPRANSRESLLKELREQTGRVGNES